ncbi:MAG: hypothetical protein H6988_02755 [Pseudomonadales bacterium]|nr:hypothetical protein [Halieaceae bacterium]MCP5163668.1 hypothetical protein [Pseudomonadales bacterium]MCP5189292.1 hypothetical protein [Pseudomonadales bacterium]
MLDKNAILYLRAADAYLRDGFLTSRQLFDCGLSSDTVVYEGGRHGRVAIVEMHPEREVGDASQP